MTTMKTKTVLSLLACLCGVMGSYGQGTLQITFDGQPVQPPDSAYVVTNYFESGMLFTATNPITHNVTFGRNGSGISGFPDDGTAYLQDGPSTLMFSFTNGIVFGLVSVDLAEYSTGFSNEPVTVPFIGYQPGGATVTNYLTTDGIIDGTGPLADFQTFYFTNFTDLTGVEIPGPQHLGWSLDNLVLSVPEPTASGLLVLGGLAIGALSLRCRFTREGE
jgi:hypothetical protein